MADEMMHQRRLQAFAQLAGASLILLLPLTRAHAQSEAARRFATVLARRASDSVNVPTPTVAAMELATVLLQEAIALDPNDVDLRRRLLAVARMSENDELRRELVADIAQLDPKDESIRLERINDALLRYQDAESLRQAYETLLSEENVAKLGPVLASRLAYDFALLHRRMGDIEQFGEWLGRATALDQSNKAAAAMAAGYFALTEDDPFAQTELLVNLLMSDPGDIQSQATLSRQLLEYGAYRSAARMYALAVSTHTPAVARPPDDLMADLALARWGAGDVDAALETIRTRTRELDRLEQFNAWREDPLLRPIDRALIRAPVPRTLAAVHMAILSRQAGRLAQTARESFTSSTPTDEAKTVRAEDDDDDDVQRDGDEVEADVDADDVDQTAAAISPQEHILRAWVAAYEGAPADDVLARLEAAEQAGPVTSRMKELFAAWAAARRGEVENARALWDELLRTSSRDRWLARQDTAIQLGAILYRFEETHRNLDGQLERIGQNPDLRNESRLEVLLYRALLASWLGHDAQPIRDLVARAEEIGPLNEIARARFEGWIALRSGEVEKAMELFSANAATDTASKLGLALAQMQQGDEAGAARTMLDLSRSQPGTLIGVWCRDYLAQLLGRTMPLPELAQRLDRLISTIPSMIDRLATDPTRIVSIRLEPQTRRFAAYEPVIVTLTVSNNAGLPVGIHPDGPIFPQVLLEPRLAVAHRPGLAGTTPIMLDISRRLRLEPHERMEIPFDLRRYPLADMINASAANGANVDVKATLNMKFLGPGNFQPGPLGSIQFAGLFRVEGADVSEAWVEETTAAISEPDSWSDMVRMGLLADLISRFSGREGADTPVLAHEASRTLALSFAKLPGPEQAWLVSVLPTGGELLDPVRQTARSSADHHVKLAYLLTHLTGLEDPMLLAAVRSENPTIRRVGQLITTIVQQRGKIQAREAARN